MPLTPFQKDVLLLLAANRNPDSHVAGGTVINRSAESPRFSSDIDFFHDTADRVYVSAEADAATLAAHGITLQWTQRQPYMHRARIRRGSDETRLDWCYDSAFRFFPVVPDPDFGYRLHPADAATNKVLTLTGRSEIRDFLDLLYLNDHYLSLDALCWAACGKDPGFTPWSILDLAQRQMKFRQEHLAGEVLVKPVRLTDLKQQWLSAVARALDWFARMPANEVGCLYLDPQTNPVTPEPNSPEFQNWIRHYGSLRGAWPTLAPTQSPADRG